MLSSLLSTLEKRDQVEALNKELRHLSTIFGEVVRLSSCRGMSSHSAETNSILIRIAATLPNLQYLSADLAAGLERLITFTSMMTLEECEQLRSLLDMNQRNLRETSNDEGPVISDNLARFGWLPGDDD